MAVVLLLTAVVTVPVVITIQNIARWLTNVWMERTGY